MLCQRRGFVSVSWVSIIQTNGWTNESFKDVCEKNQHGKGNGTSTGALFNNEHLINGRNESV